jgi:hypothetical protein
MRETVRAPARSSARRTTSLRCTESWSRRRRSTSSAISSRRFICRIGSGSLAAAVSACSISRIAPVSNRSDGTCTASSPLICPARVGLVPSGGSGGLVGVVFGGRPEPGCTLLIGSCSPLARGPGTPEPGPRPPGPPLGSAGLREGLLSVDGWPLASPPRGTMPVMLVPGTGWSIECPAIFSAFSTSSGASSRIMSTMALGGTAPWRPTRRTISSAEGASASVKPWLRRQAAPETSICL